MKLSHVLLKQHIGWHFKKFWAQKGLLKIKDVGLEKVLSEKGIQVIRPEDLLQEKHEFEKIEIIGCKPKPLPLDQSHPNWHDRVLLTYKDNNVLLEGLTQAKILTNTVEVKEGLPESVTLKSTKEINKRVQEIILTSNVFDAEQVKLPKIKDPERPAWNFPRSYGITQDRSSKLLLTNLLQLIENISNRNLVRERYLIDDLLFSYNFERFGKLIQFELKSDTLVTASKPLPPVTDESTEDLDLPDIYPITPTITLCEENIYETRNIYPINLKVSRSHPHTVFITHNDIELKNLFEEEVTEPQVFGRALLKTFTVAASYAKEKYGADVKILPKPVTVQCVYTNGRLFHFGILQLNTLDLENRVKNIWYQTNRIPLFDSCCYKVGRPMLEGYNSDVVKHLVAFYNNI